MPMLELSGNNFSSGRASFLDSPPDQQGRSARIYVKVAVPGIAETFLALLDTGAEWSILDREIAEEIGLTSVDGQPISLRHKEGTTDGKLVRTTMTMIADEGAALDVDATVFVPDNAWPTGKNFIGYSGFLENIRIALDPQNNHVYFGAP
ncbi:MAG TPA: aspartyl protease family protein [Vicinamibacterales bacterium]|jgi:predicted aspartyl protease